MTRPSEGYGASLDSADYGDNTRMKRCVESKSPFKGGLNSIRSSRNPEPGTRNPLHPRALIITLLILVCAFFRCMQACAEDRNVPPRPNIIFILADDMGYGDAGFNGQRWIQTPNMDRLAREGVVFTNHYCGGPMCTPSRCSLMTGMHGGHLRLPLNGSPGEVLAREDITVAAMLRAAGYATHFVGKWGLGGVTPSLDVAPGEPNPDAIVPGAEHGLPLAQGFDTSYAFLDQSTAHKYYPQTMWRDDLRVPVDGNAGVPVYEDRKTYIHDVFTAEALDIARKADGVKPFYLQLSYTIPHRETKYPHWPHENTFNPYAGRDWTAEGVAPKDADIAYAAMITYMDRDIGRLLDAVDANPAIADNTLIIFTSDNGPQFTDGHAAETFNSAGGYRGKKFYLYEGGIRAPFAARWRGRIPPGTRSAHVSGFADFLPTAAELAGAAVPVPVDGVSYLPALLGDETSQREHEYMVWTQLDATDRPTHAVRERRTPDGRIWKLLRNPDGSVDLYDLAVDPGETRNVADASPDIVKELQAVLERECTGPRAVTAPWRAP